MRSTGIFLLSTILGLLAAPCNAQGPIGREAFVSTVMVVTDQQAFVQVFTGSPDHGKAVLWVEIPEGVEGIGADETIEREGRNGLVIMAHTKYIFSHRVLHTLRFFDMVEKDGGITAYFKTYNNEGATMDLPILKGKIWMPVFDGLGPAEVEFLDHIPADRRSRKADKRSRRSKK